MNNKIFEAEQAQAIDDAAIILDFCKEQFDEPIDALFGMVVAIAAISKGVGMSLPDLFEGITLASNHMVRKDAQ